MRSVHVLLAMVIAVLTFVDVSALMRAAQSGWCDLRVVLRSHRRMCRMVSGAMTIGCDIGAPPP